MELSPREPVVLASDFATLVAWYRDVLGFAVRSLVDEGYHYANLETATGVRMGIADAAEMGVTPNDRANNAVVLQFEVPDVPEFLKHVAGQGAAIVGPSFDENGQFWFGGFSDLEGNPCWVVDPNCP